MYPPDALKNVQFSEVVQKWQNFIQVKSSTKNINYGNKKVKTTNKSAKKKKHSSKIKNKTGEVLSVFGDFPQVG
jgi:hypothetical protein